jgi:hypothetical protein
MPQRQRLLRIAHRTSLALAIVSLGAAIHFGFEAYPLWRRYARPMRATLPPDAGPLDRLIENLASLSDTLHQHSEAMYALALAGLGVAVVLYFVSCRMRD